jgi:hypothetical protein
MSRDLEAAVGPVAAVFEALGIDYYLAGSVVSSLFGVARATADVDVVAALGRQHAHAVAASLGDAYYVDDDMILDAIQRRSMFNVIHLATMIKVDVYVAGTAFDRSTLDRRVRDTFVVDGPAQQFDIATAEDVVLHKLRWFRDGGETSERQWGDILGVLRVQRALDLSYMRRWAVDLGVEDLFERALGEAAAPRRS